MPNQAFLVAVLLLSFLSVAGSPAQTPPAPTGLAAPRHLRCEYLVDPLGIDQTAPRLSWEMVDSRRGAIQTAYQILVADDPELLKGDKGDLWDTGQIKSDQSIQVVYAGQPLKSRMHVWWKVRVWDKGGQPSPWSEPARWSMGLLDPADWSAKWIGDPTPVPPVIPDHNGYHSEVAKSADAAKWVAIDLGAAATIDGLRLHPARPFNWRADAPGFLFPLRFKVEVAESADFTGAKTVLDKTAADVPNPGNEPQTYAFSPAKARYVRLTVTRLAPRDAGEFGFALAEMELLAGGKNVAQGKPVTAADSIENNGWSAKMLVDGDLKSHAGSMEPLPAVMLRKEFGAEQAVKRATVYVTALGLYELHINGPRVGDHILAPEWTDYTRRVQYQTYDVTALIKSGQNAIGAVLGDGWYAGKIGLGGEKRAWYGRQPRLLLRLDVELADGKTQTIVSDESWRATLEGPIRQNDILDGETYDARREMPGWDAAGFDDANWQAARMRSGLVGAVEEDRDGTVAIRKADVVAQPNEPIRVVKELKPIALAEPKPGVYVFDLGQNMVGWSRMKLRGEAGRTVTFRYAEVLNPDGTIYTANLRGAKVTDRYTLRGRPTGVSAAADAEVFEPHFTYHGFRYVEVTGLPEKPALEDLVGRVFHSAAPDVGRFECSDLLLNKLVQNIVWTQRANLESIPTDCPQRDERLGWMGDILAFAQAGCFNLDMAAFFTKWVPDVRDAQADDGRYPDFAPHPYDPNARFSGVPAWGDAGVFVPWCAYVNYADTRLLAEHFESARRWVDWIHANNPDLLWKNKRHNDYGDWLNADTLKMPDLPKGAEVPKDVFSTMFFARSTELVARMAKVLGRDADAAKYTALHEGIKAAFLKACVKPDGRMEGNTQAGYAIALHFDLLPENLRPAAVKSMVDAFQPYKGNLSTGFHSTICLMNELNRAGLTDEAYRLLKVRTMPSWLYPVEHGATTIWERWDGYVEGRGFQDPGMNSFAHYAFGCVGEWMYRTIIGINPDEQHPGYKHFVLRPRPGGGLTWAKGEYDSIHGTIASAWKLDGGVLTLDVTIPANTTATLYVPAADAKAVTEGGQPVDQAEGVKFVKMEDGAAVFSVGAGSYRFAISDTGLRK